MVNIQIDTDDDDEEDFVDFTGVNEEVDSETEAESALSSLVQDVPEIHTYQEIVEIIETVQVPKVRPDMVISPPPAMPQIELPESEGKPQKRAHKFSFRYSLGRFTVR